MNVSFIGLGHMGGDQVRQIVKTDVSLTVFDVFPEAMQAFAEQATLASSPADAARGADVVQLCVRDDQQVLDTLFGSDGVVQTLAPGSLVVVHSTVRLDTVTAVADRLKEKGIDFMDAPVSRTAVDDDGRFVFTMTGGDPALTERVRPLLESFSTNLVNVGPTGAAMALKISNNLVTWVQLVVGSQAVKLAGHFGVPFESLKQVMSSNGNLTPTMDAFLSGQQAMKNETSADYDAYMSNQAGIGEKDLQVAAECGALAEMDMSLALHARDQVRPVFEGK